jgi:hypothetical protein
MLDIADKALPARRELESATDAEPSRPCKRLG